MNHVELLLTRIGTLREKGLGGEALEEALDAVLPHTMGALDVIDTLRVLYVENSDANRVLVRWALAELDTEVAELEEVLLAA